MNRPDLVAVLSDHLHRRQVPHAHGDLIAFVEACGPVEEPVDVDRWCREFLDIQLFGLVEGIDVARVDAGK